MPSNPRLPLRLPTPDRQQLVAWTRAGTTPQRVAMRARIVLLAADGLSTRAIAARLKVSPHTAVLWRQRYDQEGPPALWKDAPGRGRKPSIRPEAAARVRALLAAVPPDGRRWSIRRLAEATGLSRAAVHRILRSPAVP